MVSPSASSTFPCPVQCVSLIPMMSMPLLVISLDTMAMFPLRYSVLTFQFPIFMVSFGCSSRIGPEASSRLWPLGVMLSLLGLAAASRRLSDFALLVVSTIACFFPGVGYWPSAQPPTWRTSCFSVRVCVHPSACCLHRLVPSTVKALHYAS